MAEDLKLFEKSNVRSYYEEKKRKVVFFNY